MILEGIAAWAHIQKPTEAKTVEIKNGPRKGKKFPVKSQYKIDLIIDDTLAAELRKKKYSVKKVREAIQGLPDYAGKRFINISKLATYKDGNPTPKPVVYDNCGRELSKLVGNGSRVQVQFEESIYQKEMLTPEHEMVMVDCVAARLEGVRVLELVEFKEKKEVKMEFKFDKAEGTEEFSFDDTEVGGSDWE